jgi:hypothetical protein
MCAPCWAQNDFTGDPNVIMVQNFETADRDNPTTGLWYDSSGNGQHFTESGSPDVNDVNDYFKQGASSGYFDAKTYTQVGSYLRLTDADLSAKWPFKSTFSGTVKFSYCAWFRIDGPPDGSSNNAIKSLFGQYKITVPERVVDFGLYWDGSIVRLKYSKGYNSGASVEASDGTATLVSGRWYHVGLTYDDTDHSVKIRLWDDTAGAIVDNITDTHENSMDPSGSAESVFIGNRTITPAQYYEFDGWMDEVVFFDDILTSAEIDQIRLGTYGAAAMANNWWWRRRHN